MPGNWLHLYYFEAINILFRVENALRIFVYIILKKHFKDKWKDLSITSDDEENSTIGAIAKRRLTQDKNYAYLGFIINSPLLHLTSGELIRIITSDSYWKYFKNYFLGSKEIIGTKLDEIGNVRNSVAHFRPIKEGDLDLVKQNSIHALSEIEIMIIELINCSDIVPSNTEEEWYKELSILGTENCSVKFMQSTTEDWVKLVIFFHPKFFPTPFGNTSYDVRTLNLKTNSIIREFPDLTKYIICSTEKMPSGNLDNIEAVHNLKKQINLIFSRDTLAKYHKEIKTELEGLFLQINNESELICQDNLARGKLIESIQIYVYKHDEYNYFNFQGSRFKSKAENTDGTEYWGNLNNVYTNFISDTEIFPWINVKISDDKSLLPF